MAGALYLASLPVLHAAAPREGECPSTPLADEVPFNGSLKHISVTLPPQLSAFVRDREAAIALGKALFWDMQVGSDGIQACASCHYRAGADPRSKNALAPGGPAQPHATFTWAGANYTLKPGDFPLHEFADPADRHTLLRRDYADIVGSPGIKWRTYRRGAISVPYRDASEERSDPVFKVADSQTRRTTRRHAPSVINAVFNRRNFWDGRAEEVFNGVNAFGVRDPNAQLFAVDAANALVPTKVRIERAALASQAVAPPLDDTEMSYTGRTFPDIGKRLLPAVPLAQQIVHPRDSVLGSRAVSQGSHRLAPGLATTYERMIAEAFHPRWWQSEAIIVVTATAARPMPRPARPLAVDEYRLIEYNFSLFFGLAIQLYESTLVSDDAPFDRYVDGQEDALSRTQKTGFGLFVQHSCAVCHAGAEFTNASSRILYGTEGAAGELIKRMPDGNCNTAVYDQGFYNIGVRPHAEDPGLGADDPYGNPLSLAHILTMDPQRLASPELLRLRYPHRIDPPLTRGERVAVQGAFKVPSLRNVALTAPYFHNGSQASLRQVLEFYNRGGDFRDHNGTFIDFIIGSLHLRDDEIESLVAFLSALTDERVATQRAPFDHPQLFVPNGHAGDERQVATEVDGSAQDLLLEIPAVGREGGPLSRGFLE